MIDNLYYSNRGGVKTLLRITNWITKSFVIHYERFERTHCKKKKKSKASRTLVQAISYFFLMLDGLAIAIVVTKVYVHFWAIIARAMARHLLLG